MDGSARSLVTQDSIQIERRSISMRCHVFPVCLTLFLALACAKKPKVHMLFVIQICAEKLSALFRKPPKRNHIRCLTGQETAQLLVGNNIGCFSAIHLLSRFQITGTYPIPDCLHPYT